MLKSDEKNISTNSNTNPNINPAEVALKEGQRLLDEAGAALEAEQAVALCDKAIEAFRRGRELIGDDPEAQSAFRNGIASAYSQRGHQHRYAANFKAAVADLSQAIRFNPAYADDYYYRALSYLKLNEPKQASKDFNEFIRKTEDGLLKQDAEQRLAALVPKDDPGKGLEHWRSEGTRLNAEASKLTQPLEGVEPDPAGAVRLYNRALESFEKARALNAKDLLTNLGLLAALRAQAECYLQLNEYDLAIENFSRAIAQRSEPYDIFRRGEAYRKIGQQAAAKQDFTLYIKTGKDVELLEQARHYLDEKPT